MFEPVQLTIAGQTHQDWDAWSVDSNILIPADAWGVRVAVPDGQRPAIIKAGASVTITIGPDLVLTGRIDSLSDKDSRASKPTLALNGRDLAGVLTDCSAPIFTGNLVSLADIVNAIIKPLGISKIRIEKKGDILEKVNVEPGDTAWQALQNAAEANGLWPWIEPDGTLVIGGPRYDLPPVATLINRHNGDGNNISGIEEHIDLTHSYSHITVLGQSYTGHERTANAAIKATWHDQSAPYYRPKIVVDHEVTSVDAAKTRARKLQQDSRLKGYTLKITVPGHRITPDQPGAGKLWQPGQRIHVISERHSIDAIFYLIARRFSGGRHQPSQTELTLKEDGVWITQVHAHQRRQRKQRSKKGPGVAQTIDFSGS